MCDELFPKLTAEEQEAARRQFCADAVAAWEDYVATGLHLTGEEADAWLRKLAAGERPPIPTPHR